MSSLFWVGIKIIQMIDICPSHKNPDLYFGLLWDRDPDPCCNQDRDPDPEDNFVWIIQTYTSKIRMKEKKNNKRSLM